MTDRGRRQCQEQLWRSNAGIWRADKGVTRDMRAKKELALIPCQATQ